MGNYGTYPRSLDSRYRVSVPAKFKDNFGDRFFIVLGFDNVIEMWTESDFRIYTQKLDQSNYLDAAATKFKRAFYQRSSEVEVDAKGRFVIPENFIKKSAIKKDVVFIGAGSKVEIWSSESQEEFDSMMDDSAYSEAAKAVFENEVEKSKEK
ncbi:MraZ protein [Mycoplasma testudineum]|uniref:Transcriptional regulator MraZ n=2 Tax=Mycoplasma testudineum TaxID=244584 RepID=A0A4R6IH58_9MOLU|nr:MraZ protein [Mycoplasma testudineum]